MAQAKTLKARVLFALLTFKPNDLVEGSAATVKAYEKDGLLDTSKAAVEYVISQGAKVQALPDKPGEDSPDPTEGMSDKEKAAYIKANVTLDAWKALTVEQRNALIDAK